MKITGINIGEYRQFKDVEFDFTYPKGHSKEGKPLEKVCFIGQSGTGKTTLLRIIREYSRYIVYGFNNIVENGSLYDIIDKEIPASFLDNISISSQFDKEKLEIDIRKETRVKDISDAIINNNNIIQNIKNTNKISIYVSDSIANEAEKILVKEIESKDPFDFIKTTNQVQEDETKKNKEIERLSSMKGIWLGEGSPKLLWELVLKSIINYDNESKRIAMKLIQNNSDFSTSKLISELVKWKSENINPRLTVATDCLNPILEHFFLEVDIEDTSAPLVLKTKNGSAIVNSVLSTGTKQLVASALPLYSLDTKDAIILFDEPERSLFPDIQRMIIHYYISLTNDAQFFFATHSPIIASAFEPCERFILSFNEKGEVKYSRGIAPEGDDPNDILRQDFGISELMLDKGIEEYQRYRQLATQIREEQNEEKKNQLIVERLELGNRYNFAGRNA